MVLKLHEIEFFEAGLKHPRQIRRVLVAHPECDEVSALPRTAWRTSGSPRGRALDGDLP